LTGPLSGSECPTVARFDLRGNVFIESSPSSGYTGHDILCYLITGNNIKFANWRNSRILFSANVAAGNFVKRKFSNQFAVNFDKMVILLRVMGQLINRRLLAGACYSSLDNSRCRVLES
jgi:hypothetical protein